MDIHQNAKAAPPGRRLMVPRLADGRPMSRVAAAFGVTPRTVGTWQARPALAGEVAGRATSGGRVDPPPR